MYPLCEPQFTNGQNGEENLSRTRTLLIGGLGIKSWQLLFPSHLKQYLNK